MSEPSKLGISIRNKERKKCSKHIKFDYADLACDYVTDLQKKGGGL